MPPASPRSGSWTLGATARLENPDRTSGTLTGSPVTFTATGTAGTATTIALKLGDGQSATVGTDVAILPSVSSPTEPNRSPASA